MNFDDTTTNITLSSFDEDKTLILDGKQRLKYFSDSYHSDPVLNPLSEQRASLFKRMQRILKK
jgi:hypothetical protein